MCSQNGIIHSQSPSFLVHCASEANKGAVGNDGAGAHGEIHVCHREVALTEGVRANPCLTPPILLRTRVTSSRIIAFHYNEVVDETRSLYLILTTQEQSITHDKEMAEGQEDWDFRSRPQRCRLTLNCGRVSLKSDDFPDKLVVTHTDEFVHGSSAHALTNNHGSRNLERPRRHTV